MNTENNLSSTATALSHDIKSAVGTIVLRLNKALIEIRKSSVNSNIIKSLISDIDLWKQTIDTVYSQAEDLTQDVRNGQILTEPELSTRINQFLLSPIENIQSDIDASLKNLASDGRIQLGYLREARTSVSRVYRILEGLLFDLSDDNSIIFKQTNLRSHAANARNELMQLISETDTNIVFENSTSMLANQPSILVLFMNLIENSIKYRHQNIPPYITIAFADESLQQLTLTFPTLFDDYEAPEKWVTVTISDNGIGIPEMERQYVFDMGYRSQSASGVPGSGYGLARVKSIIKRHKGKFVLDESEFGGLKIICFFPADPLEVTHINKH